MGRGKMPASSIMHRGLSASWERETTPLGRRIPRWDTGRPAVVGNPVFCEHDGGEVRRAERLDVGWKDEPGE